MGALPFEIIGLLRPPFTFDTIRNNYPGCLQRAAHWQTQRKLATQSYVANPLYTETCSTSCQRIFPLSWTPRAADSRLFLESGLATSFCECKPPALKRILALAVVALSCFSSSVATHADVLPVDFFQSTHLIGGKQGSSLSDLAKSLSNGGYETAEGSNVRLDKWYAARSVDIRLDFITQISPRLGVLWGFSTGERGEKYTIDPSFKYGFLAVYPISKGSKFSFSATTTIGGRFRERSCTADYGDIGGVQQVNCRMAATEMDPAQTLNHLVNQEPSNRNQVSLQYTINF